MQHTALAPYPSEKTGMTSLVIALAVYRIHWYSYSNVVALHREEKDRHIFLLAILPFSMRVVALHREEKDRHKDHHHPRHYPKKAVHRSVIARDEAIWDYRIVYQAARLLRPSQ